VVAHHLAKAIIYSASSQAYFDIPTCIDSSPEAVLWPGDPGLRPNFFAISYVNPYEFII
jgi:hypothetical protein